MTILISREISLFNFEPLDIWRTWIGSPCEKLWSFELLNSFHCSILSVSIYFAPESDLRVKSYHDLNCSGASIVQFRVSRELPLFNFVRLDILCLNRTSEWKVMAIWISRELPLFNFERLDIFAPESDLRVKSYDYLNFSRGSVF